MHIIIGIITALGGLIWALYRLQNSGVDLNSFNPFFWARRRKWEKLHGTKPMHRLEEPLEAASLLVVAVATYEKDITRDLKNDIVGLFVSEFSISNEKAMELYSASMHLLKDVGSVEAEVRHILAPSKSKFSPGQVSSLLSMAKLAAEFESSLTEEQARIIKAIEKEFVGINR